MKTKEDNSFKAYFIRSLKALFTLLAFYFVCIASFYIPYVIFRANQKAEAVSTLLEIKDLLQRNSNIDTQLLGNGKVTSYGFAYYYNIVYSTEQTLDDFKKDVKAALELDGQVTHLTVGRNRLDPYGTLPSALSGGGHAIAVENSTEQLVLEHRWLERYNNVLVEIIYYTTTDEKKQFILNGVRTERNFITIQLVSRYSPQH